MGVCVVEGAAGREAFVRVRGMLLCSVGGGEKGEEDGDDEVEDETPHTRSWWSVTI